MRPLEQLLVWQQAHATDFAEFDARVQEVRMLHGLTLRIRQRAKP